MREPRSPPDPRSPVAVWKEDDMFRGERQKAMVIIFRTIGCWWAKTKGCTMCGYNLESPPKVTLEDLKEQLAKAMAKYQGETMIKMYTSGSFLDEREIPSDFRDEVFASFPSAKVFLFESRPEFVTADTLGKVPKERCMVALGLESASDDILSRSIRKGFLTRNYLEAAKTLKESGVAVRTYLILKPPFLTEKAAMDDTLRSIELAGPLSESVSINPMNVQNGTMVEDMWRRGDLRTPWLWSLVEVLRRGKRSTSTRLMSAPSGGGTPRGAHNCSKCDRKVLDAIERFSFDQDLKHFEGLDCDCHREWEGEVKLLPLMRTAVDVVRHLEDEPEL